MLKKILKKVEVEVRVKNDLPKEKKRNESTPRDEANTIKKHTNTIVLNLPFRHHLSRFYRLYLQS